MNRESVTGSWREGLLGCLLVAALAGCTGTGGGAPVADRGTVQPSRSGQHTVRDGDTLYSIAWRYGVDWQELARWNGLRAPWTIYPGQRLATRATAVTRGSGSATTSRVDSPAVGSTTRPPAPVVASSTPRAAAPSSARRSTPAPIAGRWLWPLEGEVVSAYAPEGDVVNKGIDIRGARGARVIAAAAGEVVYAGTGLRGHRQLVIVKHDEQWLSAYAHDVAISVAEGQQLQAGAEIARLEDAEDSARVLHFEIRHEGQPVDPANLLPQR